ncbi:oxygenase MpaB family protein [Corynebacterium sp. KPL2850]|uniref:oxygenase MpaB family protein n=1 Tax=Corynebacterium sp. KPL2850 TaxID=3158318 RepID=UPI0032F02232
MSNSLKPENAQANEENTHIDSPQSGAEEVNAQDKKEEKRELRRAPLGPDSLLWKWGSDNRLQLLRGYTGILQNMHPAIGQSLLDHSKFFDEPFARLQRSTPQIIESIYDDGDIGERIRDYHVTIKGTLQNGERYHSLNPETYYWAHATFVYRVIYAQDLFGTPFTKEERDQIVREGVTWWDKYGMSERPVIDNYDDLIKYMDDMADTVLERNQTVDFALRTARVEPVKAPEGVPEAVWKVIWKPIMRSAIWLTVATLPQKYRDILELKWTKRDQKRFDRIAKSVRFIMDHLPEDKRYMEPGRSLMIKNGMIEGKYKEPKKIQGYNAAQAKDSAATAESTDKPDSDDAVAARRAAGCPF